MKKVFLAVMAMAMIAMVGCKPKDDPTPTPSPEPTPEPSETYTTFYLSDCIGNVVKYTYLDNNGETKTLQKEDWVALDKSDIIDSTFLIDLAPFCETVDVELTDEVISHIKKFRLPNQPKSPVMQKVTKVKSAELPQEGSVVITGVKTFASEKHTCTIFSPVADASEDDKWNIVLNFAERIFIK